MSAPGDPSRCAFTQYARVRTTRSAPCTVTWNRTFWASVCDESTSSTATMRSSSSMSSSAWANHVGSSTSSSVDGTSSMSATAFLDQPSAVDLHRFAARDRVDDLDRLRNLVGKEPTFGVLLHLVERRRVGGIRRSDDRMHASAPLRVFESHDDDVGDLGVVAQRGFDLGGKHVGAAGDDEVDAPVDQVQVVVRVEVAHVVDGAEAVVGHLQLGRFAEVGRAHVVG